LYLVIGVPMPFSLNKKKVYYIIGYLVLLLIVKHFVSRSGRITMEGFTASNNGDNGIIKSFGTILRDNPEVNEKALLFQAIRPIKRRVLPAAYPANDISDPAWTKYLGYLSAIGNQQSCGACWAWATSGMLSDRFSLLSGGKIKVQMSPAKMVMCTFKFSDLSGKDAGQLESIWKNVAQDSTAAGLEKTLKSQIACAGNDLYTSVQELYIFGTPSSDCVPYDTADGASEASTASTKYNIGKNSDAANIPNCWDVIGTNFDTCADGKTAARVYRADDIYSLRVNENEIQQEIYRWGPVAAGFKVYEGFVKGYDGKSIYMGPAKNENVAGGHAIRIVGWGTDAGVNYWWIANSWSPKWGINGYFRMKRMIPECQLEQNVVGLKPEFPGSKSVWDASLDIVDSTDTTLRNFPEHVLDPISMYYNTAIQKIKDGKLQGSITPILDISQLPNGGNYNNFWVADMITGKTALLSEGIMSSSNIIFILLAVVGVILILRSKIGE
jgi:cathepsin B